MLEKILEKKFEYGQWSVELSAMKNTDFHFIRVYCYGSYWSTQGSLFVDAECTRYEDPYVLPQGLRNKINKIARKMLDSIKNDWVVEILPFLIS